MAERFKASFLKKDILKNIIGSNPILSDFEEVTEWFKVIDCKSIVCINIIGSNPIFFNYEIKLVQKLLKNFICFFVIKYVNFLSLKRNGNLYKIVAKTRSLWA